MRDIGAEFPQQDVQTRSDHDQREQAREQRPLASEQLEHRPQRPHAPRYASTLDPSLLTGGDQPEVAPAKQPPDRELLAAERSIFIGFAQQPSPAQRAPPGQHTKLEAPPQAPAPECHPGSRVGGSRFVGGGLRVGFFRARAHTLLGPSGRRLQPTSPAARAAGPPDHAEASPWPPRRKGPLGQGRAASRHIPLLARPRSLLYARGSCLA